MAWKITLEDLETGHKLEQTLDHCEFVHRQGVTQYNALMGEPCHFEANDQYTLEVKLWSGCETFEKFVPIKYVNPIQDDPIFEILTRIFYKIYEDSQSRAKYEICAGGLPTGEINYFRMDNASGNHAFDDYPELFNITEHEGHHIRAAFQQVMGEGARSVLEKKVLRAAEAARKKIDRERDTAGES